MLSDTHGMYRDLDPLPHADILIHCGDITGHGTMRELTDFNDWLGGIPIAHKLVIAGNHDMDLERHPDTREVFTNAIYLQDELVEVMGLRIYGSPWTPTFGQWAFMKYDSILANAFMQIPAGLDVLVTHGPPHGFGDATKRHVMAGSHSLRAVVDRVKPRFHVFGHIHEDRGTTVTPDTTFINASTCDYWYDPVNPPVVFDA